MSSFVRELPPGLKGMQEVFPLLRESGDRSGPGIIIFARSHVVMGLWLRRYTHLTTKGKPYNDTLLTAPKDLNTINTGSGSVQSREWYGDE